MHHLTLLLHHLVCFVLGHVVRMVIVRLASVVIRCKEVQGGVFHMRIVAVAMDRELVMHVAQELSAL